MTLPYTIQSIIDQTGGHRLNGAFAYIGAHKFVYSDRGIDNSKFENGSLSFGVGLIFKVNGGSRGWKMCISLEPSDTYTVRLMAVRGGTCKLLDVAEGVYCDMLQSVVETMYDGAIKKYCGGFISI